MLDKKRQHKDLTEIGYKLGKISSDGKESNNEILFVSIDGKK